MISYILIIAVFTTYHIKAQPQINPHDYFTTNDICIILSTTKYDQFFNLISLRCKWNEFVMSTKDPKRYVLDEQQTRKGSKKMLVNYYNIEFYLEKQSKYRNNTRVFNGLFKNFNLKSLTLRNLNLDRIDEDSFSDKKTAKLIESLDLSLNNLKKIESNVLSNMINLEHLNLSFNRYFSLDNNNFKSNEFLSVIDLSNNDIQYLPSNAFNKLNLVKRIDLSNNDIQEIDACSLDNVQSRIITSQYSPALIQLKSNPIKCDCDLFYLHRERKLKLDLICESPADYKHSTFESLKKEDPSERCQYSRMKSKCEKQNDDSAYDETTTFLILFIIFLVFSVLLLIASLACFVKNTNLHDRLRSYRKILNKAKKTQRKNKNKNDNQNLLN